MGEKRGFVVVVVECEIKIFLKMLNKQTKALFKWQGSSLAIFEFGNLLLTRISKSISEAKY